MFELSQKTSNVKPHLENAEKMAHQLMETLTPDEQIEFISHLHKALASIHYDRAQRASEDAKVAAEIAAKFK
jgi:hypothetical protein